MRNELTVAGKVWSLLLSNVPPTATAVLQQAVVPALPQSEPVPGPVVAQLAGKHVPCVALHKDDEAQVWSVTITWPSAAHR
jgi:hypothetical protein